MEKKIIFEDTFLVSGIMCHSGCGSEIQACLNDCLEACKHEKLLPEDSTLIVDAEPQTLGIHRLSLIIKSAGQTVSDNQSASVSSSDTLEPACPEDPEILHNTQQSRARTGSRGQAAEDRNMKDQQILIAQRFRASLHSDFTDFEVIDSNTTVKKNDSRRVNWINILVNMIAMVAIMALSISFPPSLFLTAGMTTLSLLSSIFTARHYLISFFHNLRNKNIFDMTTTITLGCFLSFIHTLYHSVTMPLASSFSMIFMSFIMPLTLLTIINGMDIIKQTILNKSKKIHLDGLQKLFPQMADEYPCYQPDEQELEILSQLMGTINNSVKTSANEYLESIKNILNKELVMERKASLKTGMIIKINHGECFPVDCILIDGNTRVDASLLTGEPQQGRQPLDTVPAGSINLGSSVTVYARQDSYHSTVNKILFRSNRAETTKPSTSTHLFSYLYTALIVTGIVASIGIPLVLGVFSLPLLLQNVMGILFAVCPCTIAIAHQLPTLLGIYQRNNKNILLRNERLSRNSNDIHTVVFDKTGTLTTGNSQVESFSEGISTSIWERIYLLEKHHGAEHPIARAIIQYHNTKNTRAIMFDDIEAMSMDSKNRGLSAVVQGTEMHIGNADYLTQAGIELPQMNTDKISRGFSAVYVAENRIYKGVIFIKHELRKGILAGLARLKNEKINTMIISGDRQMAVEGFNQENGAIFDLANIHGDQTPDKKDSFLSELMRSKGINPEGVWFVGDGLNDAPCSRTVTEKGGVSCAMTSNDKSAFFTDISLNGTLDYVLEHNKINRFIKKNVLQNQWLLAYGSLAFLAFMITFSAVGIAMSPLLSLLIMSSTTMLVLFNSYRVPLAIDNALNQGKSWLKQLLASDLSLGLVVASSTLFMCSLLISSVTAGGLAFPTLVFTTGAFVSIGSVCILAAGALFASFALLSLAYLFYNPPIENNTDSENDAGLNPVVEVLLNENKKEDGVEFTASALDSILPDQGIRASATGCGFGYGSDRRSDRRLEMNEALADAPRP